MTLEFTLSKIGKEKNIRYSLERFQAALNSVGNPEREIPTIVLGGTNGKGTTTLLVSSALKEAGYEVATYLSPHLQDIEERFLFNLAPENAELLDSLALEMASVAEKFSLSYFEFLTLICFLWARMKKPDYLVLEVGMGGRLDATNVTEPEAAILSQVALDHQAYLGTTPLAILKEKLGIVKPHSPLFTSIREPELVALIEQYCKAQASPVYFSHSVRVEPLKKNWEGQEVLLDGNPFWLSSPSLGMLENATLAYLALKQLFPRMKLIEMQKGFAGVKNPGRMELISEIPRVILSGDHNLAGIEDLKKSIGPLLESSGGRLLTLCGFSTEKPFREMYDKLREMSDEILLTKIEKIHENHDPAYSGFGPYLSSASAALKVLQDHAEPSDTILVTGSLYLVGEIRSQWHPRVSFLKAPPTDFEPRFAFSDLSSPARPPQEGLPQNFFP